MRALDILQERNVKKNEFRQIMADDSIKLGFECEMEIDGERYGSTDGADPNELDWNDLVAHLDMSHRTEDRLDEAYNNFVSEQIGRAWDEVKYEYTRDWCESNGKFKLPDDLRANDEDEDDEDDEDYEEPELSDDEKDEIIDKYEDEARENWDINNRQQIEDDITMESFISDAYGSNTDAMRALDIEPSHGWNENVSGNINTEDDDDGSMALDNCASDLFDVIGHVEVSNEYHGRKKSNDSWYLEPDGSITTDGGVAAELVSPVFSLTEGLEKMNTVFEWMSENHHTSNTSTGLHVTLSIEGKDFEDYDFLKMLIFFDENYTASLFNRIGNSYAQQMRDKLINMMERNGATQFQKNSPAFDPMTLLTSRNMSVMLMALKAIGDKLRTSWDKYASVSARTAGGAFEFRGMGGEQYQQKFDVVRSRVISIANVLRIGSDPTILAREYISKVFGILHLEKYQNPQLDGSVSRPGTAPFDLSLLTPLFKIKDIAKAAGEDKPLALLHAIGFNLIKGYMDPLTLPQRRQLYTYALRRKVQPDAVRLAFKDDDLYNRVAAMLKWPLALSRDQDARQEALPFARPGHASGEDKPSEPRPDPYENYGRPQLFDPYANRNMNGQRRYRGD